MNEKIKQAKALIKQGSTIKEACRAADMTESAFYYHGRKDRKASQAKSLSKTRAKSKTLTLEAPEPKKDQVFIFIGPAHLAQETLTQYRGNN